MPFDFYAQRYASARAKKYDVKINLLFQSRERERDVGFSAAIAVSDRRLGWR